MSSDQVVADDVPREPADAYPPDEAAIQLALAAIQAVDFAGLYASVLEVTAVLSGDAVRRDLLCAAGQTGVLVRGRRVPAYEVDQALAQLADQSLLSVSQDGQTVIMPGAVARVVRAGLARAERLTAVCYAAAAMLEAQANALAESSDRTAVRDIPGQVTALQDNAGPAAEADERLAGVLLRLRFWVLYQLVELGDGAPQAIAVGELLIADLEQVLGSDHPDTLNARNSLAAAYQAAGRAAEAVPLFEHVMVARQRVLGPKHPDTLTSQNNLAATYQDADRYAEAILLFKMTLAAREQLLGADHPSTLNSRGNLGAAYRATGRVSEAILLLEQTLAGRERVLGVGHPDVQAARDNLAAAQQETAWTDQRPPPAPPAPDPVPEPPAALAAEEPPAPTVGEEPPVVAPAAEADDDLSAGPASVPEPEPESETLDDLSEPEPQAAAIAEAPAVENLPPAEETAAEEPPAAEETAAEEPAAASVAEPPAVPAPEPPAPSRDRPARRRRRVPSLVAAIVVLLAAGGVAVALSRSHGGHSGHRPATASRPAGSQPLSAASQLAAAWVAQQVARSAIVACDPLMCSALEARGVPAANLLVLRADTTSPLGAQVVVVTPAVRSQFGSRMDSVYAPSVIAGFGSGSSQVSVQVVAKDGPTAYLTALRQDAVDRKTAGAQLLANEHIQTSAQARAQLAAGAVDSRLLLMLPALAAVHPIQVLAFDDPAPEAGPGVPLCSADLSGSGQAARMSDVSYLRWLTSFVGTQLVPFAGSMSVLPEAGQSIVRVVFAQPSPLGLLSHT